MKLEWDEVEQHVKLTGQVFAMDFILFYFFFFKIMTPSTACLQNRMSTHLLQASRKWLTTHSPWC